MSLTKRYESVAATGGTFDAYCAIPEGGSGPGVMVFQEVFGINDNIRGLADRLAEEGYVALAPDMFWRIEPRFERKDESGMADAFAIAGKFDREAGISDIEATHAHLLGMPECTGKVGAVGFCFGGAMAFLAATTSRVDGNGPDAAVCYYGSAINDMLEYTGGLDCPTTFHYGDSDPYIPKEKVAEVKQAVEGKPDIEFFHYDAGHAFSNWDAPSMFNKDAADQAWPRTLEVFARHLH